MFNKYISLLILMCIAFPSFAGTMILEEYPIMYFPKKEGVKLEVVEDIIVDAVDRSSYPGHEWTIDSEKPGEIIARLNVRTHVLRMKIKYDMHQINVQYYDSTRLSYSENAAGTRKIHDKYKPWSGFLLKKIQFVAKRKTKMKFVDESPIKVVLKSSTGEVIKPKKIVVAAFAEIGRRAREAGIYSDEANSKLVAGTIEKRLNKTKSANYKIKRITWNKQLDEYLKNHRASILASICKENNADSIILGYLEEYIGGSAGQREMFFYMFSCKDEDVVKEKYESYDSYDDKYPYQLDILKGLKKFTRTYKPF